MFELAFWGVFTLSTSLIAATCLYDLYRRQKKQFYAENVDLDLVCHLAKFPNENSNEHHCLTLMEKYQISPNAFSDNFPHSRMTPFLVTFNKEKRLHNDYAIPIPLQSSCFGGSLKLIQFMLESGADNRSRDVNGDGALYLATFGIACRLQSTQSTEQRSIQVQLGVLIIDCLINIGCDINSRNNFGFTPLHWAGTREKWLVHHLLKRGADPSILTFFSRAPAAAFAPAEDAQAILEEAKNVHQSS